MAGILMDSSQIRLFFAMNPKLYGGAPFRDLEILSRIATIYPESVRLLSDREAVALPGFQCLRCGECCSAVKYVTVCHEDVRRWATQKRHDILDGLVIDRRRTPLMATRKESIEASKAEARALLDATGLGSDHIFELLYVTRLLECAVYVKRKHNACTFLQGNDGVFTCGIQDTKPLVCAKFPYYLGEYTDSRLLQEDSFCPSLREMAKKLKDRA